MLSPQPKTLGSYHSGLTGYAGNDWNRSYEFYGRVALSISVKLIICFWLHEYENINCNLDVIVHMFDKRTTVDKRLGNC